MAASETQSVLVHLASGIGNIILATPLLLALNRLGFVLDVLLCADYPQTAELFSDWSLVRAVYDESQRPIVPDAYDFIIPAIPPFYWPRLARRYPPPARLLPRPPDALFYQNEQEYYLHFARQLGSPPEFQPYYCLPIVLGEVAGITERTLVLAPGCKTGEMAAKRWPYFPQLAACFADVAVVGTGADLQQPNGAPLVFPAHCRRLTDCLTLRETAVVLASAGAVVGNDSGLTHLAAAVGAPTLMLFGPTSERVLGHLPPNVQVLRMGLECEPCWQGRRLHKCDARVDCLQQLSVATVAQTLAQTSFVREASAG